MIITYSVSQENKFKRQLNHFLGNNNYILFYGEAHIHGEKRFVLNVSKNDVILVSTSST